MATNDIDWEAAYRLKKALPKKTILQLRVGDLIEVKYTDAPNQVVLIVEDVPRHAGTVFLKVISSDSRFTFYVESAQVVNYHDRLVWPNAIG